MKMAESLWYYKDTDGGVHGPFEGKEMLRWLMEGYFGMDLLVRNGKQGDFAPLLELTNVTGQVPFASGVQNVYPVVTGNYFVADGRYVPMVARATPMISGANTPREVVTPTFVPPGYGTPFMFHPQNGSPSHQNPQQRVSEGGPSSYGTGPSPVPPEMDGNSSPGSPCPNGPSYPGAPGSDGCDSEGAASSSEGLLNGKPAHHHHLYAQPPQVFYRGAQPLASPPDPIQLEFMQRHLQEYQAFIETEMIRLQQARERLPVKVDAGTDTADLAPSTSESSCQVGSTPRVEAGTQSEPLTVTLAEVTSLFANLGIQIVGS